MLAYFVSSIGVAVIGAAIAVLGVFVIVAPGATRDLVRSMQKPRHVHGAVAFRILAGIYFVVAADVCSWPAAISAVGVIMLAAGFIGLFMGVPQVQAVTEWFLALSDTAFRLWAPAAIAFGAFIVYAAL